MALITYSGNTTASLISKMVDDTHSVTASFSVQSGHTHTFDIQGATKTSDLNPFEFVSGSNINYTVNTGGKITCNGTADVRITWQSDDSEPAASDWGELVFRAIAADCSITFTDFKHFGDIQIASQYNADNLTFANNKLSNCQIMMAFNSTTAVTITSCEFTAAGNKCMTFGAAGNVTFADCYWHDCGGDQNFFDWAAAYDVTMTNCFFVRCNHGIAFFDFNLQTANMTMTNVVIANCGGGEVFRTGTNITLSTSNFQVLDWQGSIIMDTCRGANFVITNAELQLQSKRTAVIANTGGNLDDVAVMGGKKVATRAFDKNIVITHADQGTPDGTEDVTDLPFNSLDSIVNNRITLVQARTITSVSNSTPDDNSTIITFTSNTVGMSTVFYGTTSIPDIQDDVELDLMKYDTMLTFVNASFISAVNADRQGFLGARSKSLPRLQRGTVYFYRPATLTPWGEWVFGPEGTFTTTTTERSRFPGEGTLELSPINFDLVLT